MTTDQSSEFRKYTNTNDKIATFYKLNHEYQTVNFVKNKIQEYCTDFGRCQMTIWNAICRLDNIIDESDPDLHCAQLIHAFQTAEELRARFEEYDWLHLVGLIHDLGKVLLLPEFGSNEQWEVVGDTYPVGCEFSDKIVYHDFFRNNPDKNNGLYNSKLGIYQENCGIDNVLLSFGHDEYLYRVLVHNKCTIPEIGLKIIRYHSFYPWHNSGAYTYLENSRDLEIKKWCKIFSQCDLYTKHSTNVIDPEKIKPYYQSLIEKYFPIETIKW
jgi:inositol oxygenase